MSFTSEIPAISKPKQLLDRVNVVKLLLMGPANAGKTVIGKRLEEMFNCTTAKDASKSDSFCESYLPTPGIDFYRVHLQEDSRSYVLWELGGQTHYQPLWNLWWKGARGVLVVVDSTAITESYLTKISDIIELIRVNLNLPFVVCLNKIDIFNCITILDELSRRLNVEEEKIVPCSAVTGLNIRNALEYLLEII